MTEIRNAPIQQRSRETLDSIMDAANELFAAKGVDGATLTQIAAEAGCSIGALYRFFPNKEALVSEYVDRYVSRLADNLPPFPDSITIDDLAALVADLVERSIRVRAQFKGYEHVRLWRYPDGRIASERARNAELALISSLFQSTPYDLPLGLIERMTVVIVDGTWPLIAGLDALDESERAAMVEEINFSLTSYIDARTANYR